MENEEKLTNRTVTFKNLDKEDAWTVDSFIRKFAIDLDLELEILEHLPEDGEIKYLDPEDKKHPIQKIKDHVKRNRNRYIIGGAFSTAGVLLGYLLGRSSTDRSSVIAKGLKDEIDKVTFTEYRQF